jgi:rhodanese-related sulfurtransferase
MPTSRELLAAARAGVREIAPEELRDALGRGPPPALVDVRESEEWAQGHLPGAVHVPRGFLEARIETAVPDRAATFHEVRAKRDPACPVCRPGAEIRFVDYEGFCAAG